jgi:branched-chain amino acid transport system substrate-binding protein
MTKRDLERSGVSRRSLLQVGAGLAGGTLLPAFSIPTFAADQPPIGTWPDGSTGDTVNVAAAVPRTGTYAVQGEDELKGWQLAVEHINNGDPLMKKIAPKVSRAGVARR